MIINPDRSLFIFRVGTDLGYCVCWPIPKLFVMYLTQHFREQGTQFNFNEYAGLGSPTDILVILFSSQYWRVQRLLAGSGQ